MGMIAVVTQGVMASPVTQVTLPITEQQPAESLDILLSEGLAKVLVRLTGNPTITSDTNLVELLKNPRDYLESYKQQTEPAELVMAFDKTQIENQLALLGVPSWGAIEPTITTWWLMDSSQYVGLVADSQAQAKTIEQSASEQGFLARLPLADLDEQALADKSVFTEVSADALRKASVKYASNAILAVDAVEQPQKWVLQWRLWSSAFDAEPIAKGQVEASDLTKASQQLFAEVNPALAKIYLVKAQNPQQLDVVVKNIDFNGYVQVSKVMALFDGKLIETSGSVVHYQVVADPKQLKAQMSLINLQEESSAEANERSLVFKP